MQPVKNFPQAACGPLRKGAICAISGRRSIEVCNTWISNEISMCCSLRAEPQRQRCAGRRTARRSMRWNENLDVFAMAHFNW
jgi:hypothetical protein